jgi:hypothetical protein
MATFAAHVVVHGDAGPVQFAPGDDLPDWAVGLVGDHVLIIEPEDPAEDALDGAADNPEAEADVAADATDADDTDDEPEASSAGPDFTAAAPRRGRTRK